MRERKGDLGAFVESSERSNGLFAGTRVGSANNTPEEIHKAQLFVASQADGVKDCTDLLDMLGLTPSAAERKAS